MLFNNPLVKIFPNFYIRWNEFEQEKQKILKLVWDDGGDVSCMCENTEKKMIVSKRGDSYFVSNHADSKHDHRCPLGNLKKKGIINPKERLGIQSKLENILHDVGCDYWSPMFKGKRSHSWLRYRFIKSFTSKCNELLFFPEETKSDEIRKIQLKEFESLTKLSGGELYVAGFMENEIDWKNNSVYIKLRDTNVKFFVSGGTKTGITHALGDVRIALLKLEMSKSGFYSVVACSYMMLNKDSYTPMYKPSEINLEKESKVDLFFVDQGS